MFETVASAVVLAGVAKRVRLPMVLLDAFLGAGTLPAPHRRHGFDVDSIVTKVLDGLQ